MLPSVFERLVHNSKIYIFHIFALMVSTFCLFVLFLPKTEMIFRKPVVCEGEVCVLIV